MDPQNQRIAQDQLKGQAEAILKDLGLPLETAKLLFYRQVIEHQGLPFEVKLQKKSNILPAPSLGNKINVSNKQTQEDIEEFNEKLGSVETIFKQISQDLFNRSRDDKQ